MGSPLSPVSAPPAASRPAPGAYTELIKQSVTPAPVIPAEQKPAAEAPPRKRLPLGLIIVLNVVLILGIVLVVYFVMRPTPPAAVPGEGVPAELPAGAPKAPAVPKPQLPAAPKVQLPKP